MAAARGLFEEQGFEATTIADIAAAADLGFGTFYRYFPDKEAVLEAVCAVGKAEMDGLLDHAEAAGTPPSIALTRFSERFVTVVHRNRDLLALMWAVATRRVATRRPLDLDLTGPRSFPVLLAEAIERIVSPAIASGAFAPADAPFVAGLIAAAHMHFLSPAVRETDEKLAIKTLCEFELRALGAREDSVSAAIQGRKGR